MTVIVITGATRGIGRAAAIELAQQGAEMAIVGRQPDRVAAVAPEIHANCFHPGVVRTGFGKNDNGIWKVMTTPMAPFFRSPDRGARSLVWLATSEQGEQLNGEYIKDEKVAQPSGAAVVARELWERSAVLVGLPAATHGSSGSGGPISTP